MSRDKAVPADQLDREKFFSLVRQHLPQLRRFVRHEIAVAEAAGDLFPGELSLEDVVDAVLLRAYRQHVDEPSADKVAGRVIRLAREQLEADINELKSERADSVHIEEDIPETPPQEQASTMGEEILYFYEPEEDLKVEDIVPDLKMPTPEQEAESKELRACVRNAMAAMPPSWRRALILHHVEGLEGAELAEAVGESEHELPQILEQARQSVRRHLVASGCEFDAPP
jgi:RNA polymerase sigma factor (sigma-70 family)